MERSTPFIPSQQKLLFVYERDETELSLFFEPLLSSGNTGVLTRLR